VAEKMRYAAGNFYINDKRPARGRAAAAGGARASGTNDKAGSWHNLVRGCRRGRSGDLVPATDHTYPHMG
jgi:1-pyrroline-5-carboxylate dehydrogenase